MKYLEGRNLVEENLADCPPPETPAAAPSISPFQFMAFATITIGTVMNIINVVNSNNNDNNNNDNNNNNNLNSDNVNTLGGRSIIFPPRHIQKCYDLESASCIVKMMEGSESPFHWKQDTGQT